MRKWLTLLMSSALLVTSVFGAQGEIGSFGGITAGNKFKTITELSQTTKKKTSTKYSLPYKENIYLSGKAETVEGTVEIKPGGDIDKTAGEGKYTETYKMTAQNKDGSAKVTRNLTLETQYIYEADRKQTTKVTTAKSWSEIITVNGQSYRLDSSLSNFSQSILEEYTPGVVYYSGNIHYDAVYDGVSEEGSKVTVSVSAPVYGYEQAYAKTETQKRSITIDLGNNKGYAIEETPTCTVYRDIEYSANEPTAISMEGNYKEIIRGEGVLSYNIIQGNATLDEDEKSGMMNIETSPTVEQLSIPGALQLKGDPAETQIKKMYSMKIFIDTPQNFSTKQVVMRKEYIAMLVRALRIEIPDTTTKKNSKKNQQQVQSPFTDLAVTDPYYKYALAAYNAGLIEGGSFNGNALLTRESLYYLNVKAIGLQRLGLGTMDTYTPFVDDNQIAAWAKSSIYAASKLGIITPSNGYVFPKKMVTKAECATFLDQLIDYLRYDLQKDYNEKMLIN